MKIPWWAWIAVGLGLVGAHESSRHELGTSRAELYMAAGFRRDVYGRAVRRIVLVHQPYPNSCDQAWRPENHHL